MLYFDIETDGLLPDLTKIHCIVIYDTKKWKYYRYDPANLPLSMGMAKLATADVICGHSIIDFDIPALKKIEPDFHTDAKIIDTKVLSRLIWPNIRDLDFGAYQRGRLPQNFMQYRLAGTHKLEAWGFRLGVLKGDFAKSTDWQEWTPAMSDYCEQDVTVTLRLHEKIESKSYSIEASEIEHGVETIIHRQTANGIHFNKAKAEALLIDLTHRRETLRAEIARTFPPFYKKGAKFTPKRDNKRLGYTEGATCTKIELVDFNPASKDHIARMFIRKYDWQPTDFAPKTGEPKVSEEILKKLDYPEAAQLAEFMVLNKRIGQISEGKQAWLKSVREDGKVYGAVNTMGAVTRRMAHFKPNLAQVPAPYSPYGPECRALFSPRPGWIQVGIDADGLEMACLGHFMAPFDNGEFVRVFREGDKKKGTDQHSVNAGILGLSRDDAKTWFYAYLYGAGNGKLGAIAKKSAAYGGKMRRTFEKGLPALGTLVDKVKCKAKSHGYLLALDKHPIPVRAMHSALNTLCQGAGAIIMKKALLILDHKLQVELRLTPGVDYEFMLNIHDEWQIECRSEEIGIVVGNAGCEAITEAGEHFNFRCPLSGSYDMGKTWADCH
jgi:DNA polymerase I-like protein with 3'-5' exonuclease and polymerase domains